MGAALSTPVIAYVAILVSRKHVAPREEILSVEDEKETIDPAIVY